MYAKSAVIAFAALASCVAAQGSATIQNNCDKTVFVQSVTDSADAKTHEIQPGQSYSENFRESGNGGGVSIKMAYEENTNEVSQFEYTLAGDQVFYDLSNINGYPFKDGGITLSPSDSSCTTITCDSGVANCQEAYNQPYDDHATHGCSSNTDLNMILCAGNGGSKKRSFQHPHFYQA